VLNRVKPERDVNNRATYRVNWWVFGEPRKDLRPALLNLSRYIATVETAKHRFFQFLEREVVPDNMLIAIALEDAYFLGLLSSRIHVTCALAAGGTLEDRPRYNKSRCFDPFPFPACTESQRERIRKIAEDLDAHRKRVQAQHPGLTLTGMYNVLEKLRSNEPLTPKEKEIHDKGLVSILKQLHDDLDAAVFHAYGWPQTLTDAEILERLVALNAERAKEEAQGHIRWLRPDYQIPLFSKSLNLNPNLNLTPSEVPKADGKKTPRISAPKKLPWPKTLPERAKAIESALRSANGPTTAEALAKQFARAKIGEVTEILETLCTLGHAKRQEGTNAYAC
jgi:hypothetical protein